MKIGCCGGIDDASVIEAAEFDFVELAVHALDPFGPEDALRAHAATLDKLSIRSEVFNGFLPPTLKVTGPDADRAALDHYVTVAFARVAALGGEIVVFGSGDARRIPDGFPRQQAIEQIDDFLKLAGDRADAHNVTIAIEPLRQAESNILNTVAEACDFATRIGHPRVTVLADFYHMDQEAEPFENLSLPERLTHVHLADTHRDAPGTGSYDYDGFAAALQRIGYTGRVSCECGWSDRAVEGPAAVTFLREKFSAL